MNVLLLSQFFSTTKGGGEYVFRVLAKTLAQNGNKVWVITNKIMNEKYPDHSNIKLIFVEPEIKYEGGLPTSFSENFRYFFTATLKGRSIIKKEKIDIIHSNNFAPALTGSLLSSITGKPHITTIHDVFSLCGKNYWKKWGKQSSVSSINVKLAPFFEKLILKLNHVAIHTVSEASKEDLVKFGAKKPIYIIPNVIEEVKKSNSNPGSQKFIYIGRLVFYKNLEVVLKALNLVKKNYPNTTLLIVGGGPHKVVLEKMIHDLDLQNNVKFAGYVQKEEKEEL